MQHSSYTLLYLTKRSLKSWNSIIQTFTKNVFFVETLHLYSSMLNSGVNGDNFTFPSVAKSCGKLRSIRVGKIIHAHTILLGFQSHVFVQTSLLDMYSKCSQLEYSRQVFDEMPNRTVVSWNSIILAYAHHSRTSESFVLFNEMLSLGTKPSSSTLVGLLSSCSVPGRSFSIHCYGIKVGFDTDFRLSNAIMNTYLGFGLVSNGSFLFESMEEKTMVSWSTIILGYARIGYGAKVFDLFNRMRWDQVEVDSTTVMGLILPCSMSGGVSLADSVHSLLIKTGFVHEPKVASLMIKVYAKCNDLVSARQIFDSTKEKNVVIWTSMIGGYVECGQSVEALNLFHELSTTNIKPNEVTIITILTACANFGSLSMGEKVEGYVKVMGFGSDLRVCTSLIHMYCKLGFIERGKEIFDGVSGKDLAMWSVMISGYAYHGRGKEALALFEEMKKEGCVKPDAIIFVEILSACSHSGLVEEGVKCFDSMRRDYGIEPNVNHYSCMVDLLSRSGHVGSAVEFVEHLAVHVRKLAWAPLLSASRDHHDVLFDEFGMMERFQLGAQDSGNYVLVASKLASLGKWKEATGFRRLIDDGGLVKEAGWSRII